MRHDYVENYFQENNGLIERFQIKSKIISRILIFTICSIIYPFLILSKNFKLIYEDEMEQTGIIKYINVAMIICVVIAIVGLIWLFLDLFVKKFSKNVTDKVSFKTKKIIFNCLDWTAVIPVCATIAIFCYSFLFIITPISGNSMNPTLYDQESVFVSYLEKIDRFDVVVLKVTKEDNFEIENDSYYIKRVIGMPNDELTWENKVLKINGEIVKESFFDEVYLGMIFNTQDFHGTFKYKENGKEEFTTVIPDGYYFVMGDNRTYNGSKDSREIGLIKAENIIGVAKYHAQNIFKWQKIK